jgi:hypothetical protein
MKEIKNSSNIEAVGHDGKTLSVRFKGGAHYDYADFPSDLHDEWMKAHEAGESAGKFFHAKIKNAFKGVKREDGK